MSQVIDNRIVQLAFDNSDFEKNTQVSMNTLKDLNKAIDNAGSGKGLAGLADSVKGFSLDGIAKSIDTISSKFGALEIAGITALTNIVNKAVDAGIQMVKSLTIAPVSQGFEEYELKMGSIQTIMAGTGESLETVNKYLNELNTYADKTIYSFADMTSNIGKFTNQGVGLKDAVAAIQGIANEAAVSGANAQQASHAMYNFAQALSAGYVKLIDWKSIENSMMATKEFKEQLLETAEALGTVTKEGDKYKSTTTNAKGDVSELFNATKAFNDNLQYQWLTTEVLTKTLAKYSDETTEIGKKAFAAAQDVKTFTQLMDTLKEAVGSGWAQSFEIIFGDFNEAKSMWTAVSNAVGGFIDKQATARNEMLQTWDTLGGRKALLDGFANTWAQIQKITEPIKKAFKDIFPSDMGKNLADISKKIGDLMSKFKITSETSDQLYRTFHGLFAILDIGKQAISAMAKAVKGLAGSFGISINDILDFTARIGDFFTEIDNKAKSLDIFNKIFSDLKYTVSAVAGLLGNFASAVATNLGEGFGVVESVVNAIRSDLTKCGDAMIETKDRTIGAIDNIKESISGSAILGILKDAWGLIKEVGNAIGTVLNKSIDLVSKSLSDVFGAIKSGNSGLLFKLLNEGLLVTVAAKLTQVAETIADVKTMFGGLADIFSGVGTTFGNIGEIFDGLGDSLEQLTTNIKVDSLLKISGAVVLLALSAMMLETIDADKIGQVLGTITTLLISLLTIMSFLTTSNSPKLGKAISSWIDARSLNTTSSILIKMAAAILLMSLAMKNLSDLKPEELAVGLGAMVGMMATLIGAMKLMPTDSKIKKAAGALITLGIAMNILAASMKIFASLSLEELGIALGGFVGTLASVVGALGALSLIDDKGIKKNAQAVEKMGIAMVILAAAFKIFASLDPDEMLIAIGGFASSLGLVVAALGVLAAIDDSSIKKSAGAIEKMGVAMVILAAAFKIFASADPDEMIIGIAGLAGSLILVTGALAVLSALDTSDISKAAGAMVVMGAAMVILGASFKVFSSVSWPELAKGLLGMAGALTMVVIALQQLSKSSKPEDLIATAGALVVMGLGIGIMADAVEQLGKLSLAELAKGLGALWLSMELMFAGLKSLGTGSANLLATAGALLIMGAAIGTFALSVKLLSTISLGAMAVALGGLVVGLAAVAGLAALLAPVAPAMLIFAAGIAAISAAVALFGAGILALGAGLGMLADALSLLQNVGDGAIDILKKTLEAALEAVVSILPEFISALANGFLQVLESFSNSVPQMIDAISALITAVLGALNEKLPAIIDSVMQFLGMLLDKLTENIPIIAKKATDLMIAFVNAISDSQIMLINAAMEAIIKFINGLSDAIEKNTPKFTDAVKRLFETVISAAITVLVGSIPFVNTKGSEIMQSVTKGLKSGINGVIQVGKDFINGFVQGVTSKVSDAISTVKRFGGDIISSIKQVFDSHSPSRVTDKIGRDFDQGLINGINKLAGKAAEAAKEMGEDTVDALNMGNISSVVDFDAINPVITPTLDLSYIQNGVNAIDNMLNGKSMSATVDAVLDARNSNNSIIGELKDEVIKLGDRISAMQIVLDSGTMVGAMTDQIDNQLGRRQVYAGRGI